MLEGQVSALSAEYLSSEKAITLVDRMFESKLYTADRNSFLLYPDRPLPDFSDKGLIPEEDINQSKLLKRLIENHDTSLIKVDTTDVRFVALLQNLDALNDQLESLSRNQNSLTR